MQRPRTFEPFTLDELSDEEVYEVRMMATAFYHAELAIRKRGHVEPPEPYSERFYVWKMVFQQLLLAVVVGAIVALVVLASSFGAFSELSWLWRFLLGFTLTLACIWTSYRLYFIWRNTVLVSDTQETGIRRPRKRWLLLNEVNQTVETASLQTKDVTRVGFASFFSLNSWRITLDAPSQKDKFLDNLGFVRNGSELKKTVQANQSYLKQVGR